MTSIEMGYALDLGSVHHNAANMLVSHLARLLDIPSCQSGCTSNEEGPTERAIEDARRGYALFERYGCHMVRHAFAFTKDLTALSFEKLERVAAALGETTAAEAPPLRMPEYDEGGFEAIARCAARSSFMQDDHTLRNVGREFA
jgi:trimethylamine:corrinoid methyltransferase-like protein